MGKFILRRIGQAVLVVLATTLLVYLGTFALSGAIVAGLGGFAVVRALARLGAVNAMPAGQEELERSAH